ncbi:MAG: aspartyl protease family protein [Chitinophagaceae bacterium]
MAVTDSSLFQLKRLRIDPVVSSDSADIVLPFSRAGNLILLKASIDSVEGSFVLDTGAPHLVLNLTYFRDLPDARPDPGEETGGITGAVAAARPTDIRQLRLGPIRYNSIRADRANLGHIENSRAVKILGLLGVQLFKRFELIIDYENSLIYLHLISRKESSTYQSEQLKNPDSYRIFPMQLFENKMLTTAHIAGKKLSFVIDTGAESNVLDSRLPDRIFEQVTITRRIVLTGSGNTKVEALYGHLRNMKLGELEIARLPVLVTNLEKLCFSYDRCIDGMLGYEFLSMQKIGFNFVKNKMYIWK